MNLRIQLPCWVGIGLLFSACATLETEGPDLALIKCPVSPAQASTAQVHVKRYLAAVAAGHRPPPINPFVAVKTLSPNKKNTADSITKLQSTAPPNPPNNTPIPHT